MKTKALKRSTVNAQLIYAFVFEHAKSRFFSDVAQFSIHHNLFITLFLGSNLISMLVIQTMLNDHFGSSTSYCVGTSFDEKLFYLSKNIFSYFTFTSNCSALSFTVNNVGDITTAAILDREAQNRYEFVVFINDISNDQTGPSRQGTARVIVNVLDRRDNNPRFSPITYEEGFFENVPVGTPILTVTVSLSV